MASDKTKDKVIKGVQAVDAAVDAAGDAAKQAPRKTDSFVGRHLSGPAIMEKIKKGSITAPYEGYEKKADPSSYKKGGVVKKSGMAKVHKGERVLTKTQAKSYSSKGKKR